MEDLSVKFNHLYKTISSSGFLKMEALGGEIPFFISAYDAAQELEVIEATSMLINKLETNGVKSGV